MFYVPEIEDNEVTFHHVAFHAVYGVEHLRQVERGEGREGGGGWEGMEGGRDGRKKGGERGSMCERERARKVGEAEREGGWQGYSEEGAR